MAPHRPDGRAGRAAMSSTTATTARCVVCTRVRDPRDLLLVYALDRPSHAVCRPSVSDECFRRATGPAAIEPIEVLADYLARQEAT